MYCPQCQKFDSKVIDSRDHKHSIRRRRECLLCGYRFTTKEVMDTPRLMVLKRNGSIESYDRQKITVGVMKACEKRPIPREKIDELIDSIEQTIKSSGKEIMPSRKIGQLVITNLKKLDHVAYLRFASVYKNFKSPASFEKEIRTLKK